MMIDKRNRAMNDSDWKWVGLRIRDIRQQRKISMKEMAGLVDLCSSSLSNIEHNRTHPSLEMVVKIVSVLDVSLDYIVRGIRPLHGTGGLVFRSDDELEQRFMLTEE